MNSLTISLITILLMAPAVFAREDSLLARVTVYWAGGGSGSDHDTRHHRCATGARLRAGHCAVDPKHIPYGSRVLLPNGETLAAVDTGSAVKNRKAARQSGRTVGEKAALVVDRFFETKGQAMAWANSHPAFMPIKVVRPEFRGSTHQPSLSAPRFVPSPVARQAVKPLIASGGSANHGPLRPKVGQLSDR